MTKTVFTVGKAPIVHGTAETEERAWQLWHFWRETGQIPRRATVWQWPNGLQREDGRYDLDGATKCERPQFIAPYMNNEMPEPEAIVTKGDLDFLPLAAAEEGPLDEGAITGFVGRVLARIRELEGQVVDRDWRIAELEAQLQEASKPSDPIQQQLAELTQRLARLETPNGQSQLPLLPPATMAQRAVAQSLNGAG